MSNPTDEEHYQNKKTGYIPPIEPEDFYGSYFHVWEAQAGLNSAIRTLQGSPLEESNKAEFKKSIEKLESSLIILKKLLYEQDQES